MVFSSDDTTRTTVNANSTITLNGNTAGAEWRSRGQHPDSAVAKTTQLQCNVKPACNSYDVDLGSISGGPFASASNPLSIGSIFTINVRIISQHFGAASH